MCALNLCVLNKLFTWTLLVLSLLSSGSNIVPVRACRFQPDSSVQCDVIENSLCQSTVSGLHFNSTSFPNIYNHRSQAEVEAFIASTGILHLRELDCSQYTSVFICTALYPLCYPRLFQRVEPCQELCMAVRESCAGPLYETTGLLWPESLDCSRFVPYGAEICVWNETSSCGPGTGDLPLPTISTGSKPAPTVFPACTGRLSVVNRTRATFGGVENCVEPCQGVYFEQDQQTLIMAWTSAVSILVLAVSILIIATFFLNYKKIHTLEHPIYCTVLCFGCLSLANIISFFALGRNSLLCDHSIQNPYNQSVLITEGYTNTACTIMFCITYYFTLCTWSWWLVLTVEWSVCSFKPCNIDGWWKKVLSHLLSWGLPIPFLISALITGAFSGDPVMQTCWIHKNYKVPFLIVPLSTAIGVCCVLLLVSFAKVVHLQKNKFKQQVSTGASDLVDPSLLVRVGYYITCHLIPMGILFGTYFYDYWFRLAWEATYLNCPSSRPSLQSCETVPSSAKPSVPVYMVEMLCSLCMGIVSLFWVLRWRVLVTWKNVCCFVCIYRAKKYNFVQASSSNSSRPVSQLETIGIRTHVSMESQT